MDFCFDDGMCVPISRRDQIQGELARLGVVEFLVPMTPGGLATEVVATVAGMPILRMGGRLVVRVLDRFRPATPDELTGGGARVRGTDALEGGGAPDTGTAITVIGGRTCVYSCVIDGTTRYVGITDNIARRGAEHMRQRGIVVDQIPGLSNLSRSDARAVEQTLIKHHGLESNGGTLINRINSISSVRNPTEYERALIRGAEILRQNQFPGF